MVYLCRPLSGEPQADEMETDAARYLGLTDIDDLENPVNGPCQWLAQRVLAEEIVSIGEIPNAPDIQRSAFL